MLKYLVLQGFLNLSADAEEEIKFTLQKFGLEEEDIAKYQTTDELFSAVFDIVEEGGTAVIAVENEDYVNVKKQLLLKFSLEGEKSSEIESAISEGRKKGGAKIRDHKGHCYMPKEGELYISSDGYYSGFCIEYSNEARIIFLPLDSTRMGGLLTYVRDELVKGTDIEFGEDEFLFNIDKLLEGSEGTAEDFGRDMESVLFDGVGIDLDFDRKDTDGSAFDDIVYEVQYGKKPEKSEESEDGSPVTLRNGEKLVVDETVEETDLTGFEKAISAGSKTSLVLANIGKSVSFTETEVSPYLNAMYSKCERLEDTFKICNITLEKEQELDIPIALAKKTRLSIKETGCDFGAAISQVIEGEKNGKPFYYAYIVIHDGKSASAKKVSTTTDDGVESLIPHAYTVMFEIIAQKADSMIELQLETEIDDKAGKRKNFLMNAGIVAAGIVAVVGAILMVFGNFGNSGSNIPTAPPTQTPTGTQPAQTSTTKPFGYTDPLTTDPGYIYPVEPTAGTVNNMGSSSVAPSTSGTFTFTVYGNGHGVGMSKTGANYYAGEGKNYLEILALYYYGATLVLGDSIPQAVVYSGSAYNTRDYIATVVESEMGSNYNTEALKAEAVAAYTFAKAYNFNVPASLHAFDKAPTANTYAAVDQVLGQYMTYNGEPIRAFTHETSAGKTASYSGVFGDQQIAYLSGGRPSYGDTTVSDYMSTLILKSSELSALVYSKTGIQLTGDPSTWLKVISHDGCINPNLGYVTQIQVGSQIFSGYNFRMNVMGGTLRSHCFTVAYTPD